MPTPQMNEVWWVANKAKTLTDAGDTVRGALKAWDAIKKNPTWKTDFKKVLEALHVLAGKATALKAKASSALHKDTIGYLDYYYKTCVEITQKLKAANGESLAKNKFNLPKQFADAIKAADSDWWVWHGDSVGFLSATKGGKGSKQIYDKYVDKRSN